MNDRAALFSFESEAALIGAAMYAHADCEAALDLLPDQFGDEVHATIWRAIREVVAAGGTPTPPIVRDRIGAHEAFEAWGGFSQLFELWDSATTMGVADHARAVADRAGRRALAGLLDDLGARITDTAAGEFTELLSDLERRAAEIAQHGATADNWINAGDMVRTAIEAAQARAGRIKYPFGVPAVDRFTNGMTAGESTLIGARPGMGKTVVMMNTAKANATAGLGTCVYSLEMSRSALGLRLACDLAYRRAGRMDWGASPTFDSAIKNDLSAEQWEMLREAQRVAANMPLVTDDRPGLTIAQIEAATRRCHRKFQKRGIEPGPVFIDHLGKVRPSVDRRGNRHLEMADVSGEAAAMSKRLGVPVVGLVQLNRQVEGRGDDKRPQLSDLRQAGELEEDARQVIFLFRPEYYLREGPDGETMDQQVERMDKLQKVANRLHWIVEKNSSGPRGQVQTFCDIARSAVREWEQ